MMRKLIILYMLLLCGCGVTKTIEVPVENTHTEYITRSDSLIVRDSIFIDRYRENDTVYLTKDKYHYIYKVKSDTIFRTDTLSQVVEVEVDRPYVPEYFKKINVMFWILISLIVIVGVVRVYLKFKI